MAAGAVGRYREAFVRGEGGSGSNRGQTRSFRSDRGAKRPPSGRRLPDELYDFSGTREALLPVLAEDQPVIDVDVEDAARPFHQVRLDAERAAQLVCQTDGLAVVVSWFAPDDFGPHRCLHRYPSGCTIDSRDREHTPAVVLRRRPPSDMPRTHLPHAARASRQSAVTVLQSEDESQSYFTDR